MKLTRIHIGLQDVQVKYLDKIGKKWGLDRTNTIRHLIALSMEKDEKAAERKKGE